MTARSEALHRELDDILIDRFADYVAENVGPPQRMSDAQLDAVAATVQWQAERAAVVDDFWDNH